MKRALIVANGDYADRKFVDLNSPVRDAGELAKILGDAKRGGFQVNTVIDGTQREVQIELSRMVADTEEGDTVLIHLSGHGSMDPRTGGFHYHAHDSDPIHPVASSLNGSVLRRILDDLPRDVPTILFVDCCYSGAMSSDFIAKHGAGDEPKFLAGTGLAVFMSSSARQRSFETNDSELGWTSAFTRAIVDGLRTGDADLDEDGFVTLDELTVYVKSRLELSSPTQTPILSEIAVDGRIQIAKVAGRRQRTIRVLPVDVVRACKSEYDQIRLGGIATVRGFLSSGVGDRSSAAEKLLVELSDDPSPTVSSAASRVIGDWKQRVRVTAPVEPAVRHRVGPGNSTVRVNVRDLVRIGRNAAVFASRDESRPILQGVLLDSSGSKLRVISTDSYRLYLGEIEANASKFRALIPSTFLAGIRLRANAKRGRLIVGSNYLELEVGKSVFMTELVEGEFPEYRPLIPAAESGVSVSFLREDLFWSLTVSKALLRKVVALEINGDAMRVGVGSGKSAGWDDFRFVDQRIRIANEGGLRLKVAVNPEFLLDAIEAFGKEVERLNLLVLDDVKPFLLWPDEVGFQRALLMPIRVASNPLPSGKSIQPHP